MSKRGYANSVLMAAFAAMISVISLNIHGCSGDGGGSTGTLSVYVTDKNSDDFAHLVISVKEVRVVPTGMGNATDNDPGLPVIATFPVPEQIDIMSFSTPQFLQQLLGSAVVPAGNYIQVRLVLEPNTNPVDPANYVVLNSDPNTKLPLDTPSGQTSGVKVLGKFEVKEGIINAIMLDFDPNTAVVKSGSSGRYGLKPTGIRIVQPAIVLPSYGKISGTITAFDSWSSATVSVKRLSDASIIAAGDVFSNFTGGRFEGPFQSFIPLGNRYKLFVNATTSGFNIYSTNPVFLNTTTSPVDLGTIHLTK